MFFYSVVPIWVYSVFILASIPFTIYVYNTKTKKEHPNHPIKYSLFPGYIYGVVSIFYRVVRENNIGELWIKFVDILTYITGTLFVLGVGYMFFRLIKDGYYTLEALDKLKRTILPPLIVSIVCIVILIIIW